MIVNNPMKSKKSAKPAVKKHISDIIEFFIIQFILTHKDKEY